MLNGAAIDVLLRNHRYAHANVAHHSGHRVPRGHKLPSCFRLVSELQMSLTARQAFLLCRNVRIHSTTPRADGVSVRRGIPSGHEVCISMAGCLTDVLAGLALHDLRD